MALGSATHLWIDGTPEPAELREWVLAARPDAREDDLLALRLGPRTLLCAVNTSDRAWWSRSVDVVSAVRPRAAGWTALGVYPDTGDFELSASDGVSVSWDQAHPPEADALGLAGERIRRLVPLALTQVDHYVEWAHEVEDCVAGDPAPELTGVVVEPLALGLPPGPDRRPPPGAAAATSAAQRVADGAVRAFGLVLLVPYLALGLAVPPLAWWHLLGAMLEEGVAGAVTMAIMEAAFALPFALTWRRMPRWAHVVVVAGHLLAFAVGLAHARLG